MLGMVGQAMPTVSGRMAIAGWPRQVTPIQQQHAGKIPACSPSYWHACSRSNTDLPVICSDAAGPINGVPPPWQHDMPIHPGSPPPLGNPHALLQHQQQLLQRSAPARVRSPFFIPPPAPPRGPPPAPHAPRAPAPPPPQPHAPGSASAPTLRPPSLQRLFGSAWQLAPPAWAAPPLPSRPQPPHCASSALAASADAHAPVWSPASNPAPARLAS